MEAVVFIGLQGAGKSGFYKQRFWDTHTRINLDTLKTRHREQLLLEECIQNRQSFVVDNTNATVVQRIRYITPSKEAGYFVSAYFFDVDVKDCLARNAQRPGKERVHPAAIFATRKRMQPPSLNEGFDAIYIVRLKGEADFEVIEQSGAAGVSPPLYIMRVQELPQARI